ncbi:alkaline phosphatase family protein [candidate division CSSED10-310 bacterium]|uniref:Alkaline phosphatase family protein n=1 Tax=candidate division CSSED10-310 bacterium TaxID=2855610 RepID=A0ABV6YU12_UNCC1
MVLFKKKIKPRVCLIGLDGVPLSMLKHFFQKGIMPEFAELALQGSLVPMSSAIPEISAVSWTSFMTGTNPGTHGVFGFTDILPQSYELKYMNFNDCKVLTIWDRLGSLGKRSVIINQPATYPARKLSGVLISGFGASDLFKAVYPAKYIRPLRRRDYQIDIVQIRASEDYQVLMSDLKRTLQSRKDAVDLLWTSEKWDYFELIITGTDRLLHYLWAALDDQDHPLYPEVLAYFRELDQLISDVVHRFQKLTNQKETINGLFILSDHGFCTLEHEVYLNTWLKNEGLLSYSRDAPHSLLDVSPETQAFILDPGRLYINRKGKFPRGEVREAQVEKIKKQIKAKLMTLEYDQKKVVQNVFDKSEIYSGQLVEQAPDLIIESQPGFNMKGALNEPHLFKGTSATGMHTGAGAFCFNDDLPDESLHIDQLAQKILRYF